MERKHPKASRRRRFGVAIPTRRRAAGAADPAPFEVQQRDASGPVRRMLFWREKDALSFADALSHWMSRRGDAGSVRILWPSMRGPLGG